MIAYLAQIERYNPELNAVVALREREGLLAPTRASATKNWRPVAAAVACTVCRRR